MVRLEGINKTYGNRTVLSDCSLAIEQGERFVLLGRSGCGKTTLLRLIAGFETPDGGRIFIENQEVNELPVEQRPVGFIFQRHALFPHMNVYDNIAVGPRVRDVAEPDIQKQIEPLLEITRLTGLRDAWPGQLSGGESQRVALARAIINKPKLLLLDEPLSALDETLRQSLREELMDMQRAFGITFLFVTHDREEAMCLADRMSVLEGGSFLQVGAPQALYDHPVDPFTAGFLGDINQLEGKVIRQAGRQVTVSLANAGSLTAQTDGTFLPDTSLLCFLRPERLILVQPGTKNIPNHLGGEVTQKLFFGNRVQYHIRLADGQTLQVRASHSDSASWNRGDPVAVVFSERDVLLFTP